MMGLLAAVIIAVLGGFTFFLIGQSLPRRWFDPGAFIYRSRKWEKGGRIYERVYVRKWKDIVPDMSRIVPGVVKKKAALATDTKSMRRLIKETCVAELVHWLLILFITPMIFRAMRGFGGFIAAVIYIIGNLVFIIIQRYNRPRLVTLYKRMEKRRGKCS